MAKRLILVGKYYIIEPLGILYLLGLARALGWTCRVVLVKDGDFQALHDEVAEFRPDVVGFSVWTGYHRASFAAADTLRAEGVAVAIGGPHATYFADDCAQHADWVVKAEGFRLFRRILEGTLAPGVHFDPERMAEGFPQPDRDLLYERYPELAQSPIKSIFCSVGCPYHCSYCYAPSYNRLYGGFALNLRPIADIVAEARAIQRRWPLAMVYFQDDVFGFSIPWLRDFVKAWRTEVGVPWHCQIRLELTRDVERLDLFREGGCTGITLAIESGNDFLRRYVLLRPMPDALIVEGVRRIQSRGLALRTQQILAVPFSDLATDLETLELNTRLAPSLAWASILAPYAGTAMGSIATDLGFYAGNNDDLDETFFARSVLRHTVGGRAALEPWVRQETRSAQDNPLQRVQAVPRPGDPARAEVFVRDPAFHRVLPTARPVATLEYLAPAESQRYGDQTVVLQRVFNWLARVPQGHVLGARFTALPADQWTWRRLGELTLDHLCTLGHHGELAVWRASLARGMAPGRDSGQEPGVLPAGVQDNPWYFCFLPSGPDFARHLVDRGVFTETDPGRLWDAVGYETRQWLYDRALYRLSPAEPPLAESVNVAPAVAAVAAVSGG